MYCKDSVEINVYWNWKKILSVWFRCTLPDFHLETYLKISLSLRKVFHENKMQQKSTKLVIPQAFNMLITNIMQILGHLNNVSMSWKDRRVVPLQCSQCPMGMCWHIHFPICLTDFLEMLCHMCSVTGFQSFWFDNSGTLLQRMPKLNHFASVLTIFYCASPRYYFQ